MQLAACRPTQCGDPFHGRSGHLGRELLWLGGPQDAKHGQVGLDRHPFHTSLLAQGLLPGNHSSGYPRGHYYLAHGGGGNTGKWIGHKGDFLEGGIRVPAMISYPAKIPQGQTRDQIVTVMDWFPTVLELCGIEQKANPPKLDGHSMSKVIADPKSASDHEVLHFGWANGLEIDFASK